MWHHEAMDQETEDQLRLARQHYDNARPTWHRAIYDALRAGAGVADVARVSGYNREHIRRIRHAGDAGELGGTWRAPKRTPTPQVAPPLTLNVRTAPPSAPVVHRDVRDDDGYIAEPFEETP